MEEDCRVFLIGDSLFTETLAQMLSDAQSVRIVGTAVSSTLDKTAVIQTNPQVIIIADSGQQQDISTTLLSLFPDIPIINADLSRDYVQVITSRRVGTRRDDLLTAIRDLVV